MRFTEDDALRISLREYANSILKDEWRELHKGRASGRTNRRFRELSQEVSAIDPAPGRQSLIYTEILKKVDELASARESRLVAAANIRLAPIFWETIVFLLLILLVLAAFSESTFSQGAAMALGCQGFASACERTPFGEAFLGRAQTRPGGQRLNDNRAF
jgi:hypothetical protein